MDRILNIVGSVYRLSLLGDPIGCIRDRTKAGITGDFGVPGENDNGKGVVEFCDDRGLYLGNKYLEYRSLHQYIRMGRGQDGVEIKSMIDLVVVKKDVQSVRAMRGM